MKYILFTILLLLGCNDVSTNEDLFNYKNNLNELIDSYIFLSETHDLLHIMMGEYEGSPINSYNDYKNQIDPLKNNVYLKPIYFGLNNIKIDNNILINADEFDALVDYYQMGIQLMIEGLLKGYGYKDKIPQNSDEYEAIKMKNFNID